MANVSALADSISDTPSESASDRLLRIADTAQAKTAPPTSPPVSFGESTRTGLGDAFHGAGELMQHIVPDRAMNWLRTSAQSMASGYYPFVSKETSESIGEPRSTEDYSAMERANEKQYASLRAAAGQKGFDWGRLTGNLLNPLNWLAPGGEAVSALGRIAQAAKIGAVTSLWQPTGGDSDFWSAKYDQAKASAITAGAFATASEALAPMISYVGKKIYSLLPRNADVLDPAATSIAEQVAQKAGVHPSDLPPEFAQALKDEAKNVLETGVTADPDAIVRQTRAASLGMKLTRGQATRDPVLYASEQKLRAIKAGSSITQQEAANQNAVITRLSDWGAGGTNGTPRAADTYSAAQLASDALRGKNKQLEDAITDAYSKVRNSEGRAATLDHVAFVDDAMARLQNHIGGVADIEKAAPEVIKVLDDIKSGKQPLNVDTALGLDKWLGRKSYSQAHGDISTSINTVRQALQDAPISDALGEETRAAYSQAKQLAASRFQLLDKSSPNYIPAFKAAVEGEAPDKFFEKYFMRGNVRDVDKALRMIPEQKGTIAGAAMRALQEDSINTSGSFSLNKLAGFIDEPANIERAKVLFGEDTTQNLINLRRAAGDAFSAPIGTDVPSYKTGKSLAGIKELAGAAAEAVLPSKAKYALSLGSDLMKAPSQARAAAQATESIPISKVAPSGLPTKAKQALGRFEKAAAIPLSVLMSSSDTEE